jgi:hypothetical protein
MDKQIESVKARQSFYLWKTRGRGEHFLNLENFEVGGQVSLTIVIFYCWTLENNRQFPGKKS